jgi:hypothetical protein
MSHFTVLVIGPNPEQQIAPYDESISFPRYRIKEVTEQNKKDFLDYYIKDSKITEETSFEDAYAIHGEEWNNSEYKLIDNVWWETSTYNPKSKWDWYKLGGRWTGYFKVNDDAKGPIVVGTPGLMTQPAPEGYADQLNKGDIDFEFMRNANAEKMANVYDVAYSVIGELEPNKTWEMICEENDNNYNLARELYWNQPRCKAWKECKNEDFTELGLNWNNPDDFIITREEYIQNARNSAGIPFALVMDGEWYERGEMGWWGSVSVKLEKNEWNEKAAELINSVPDDTLFTVFDCHI